VQAREAAERQIRALQQQHQKAKLEFEEHVRDRERVGGPGAKGSAARGAAGVTVDIDATKRQHTGEVHAPREQRASLKADSTALVLYIDPSSE
jgi:hypothetical protein